MSAEGSRKRRPKSSGILNATAAAIASATATAACARLGRRRGVAPGSTHELLPEPLGIFVREFARQSVLIAHPLDGHQERFVLVQARPAQRVDLAAQVILELLDVGGMDRLPSPEVLPPLRDAFFQVRLVRHGLTPLEVGQIGCAAGSTAMRRMPLIA